MIFLSLVFFTGDDSIKMSAASGDYGVITPIILLSQIVLFIAVTSHFNIFSKRNS